MGSNPDGRRCRCCGASDFSVVFPVCSWRTADWREFEYGECSQCSSLTLLDDIDPAPFYEGYELHRRRSAPASSGVRRAAGALGEALVFPRSPVGRLVARRVPRPEWLLWFAASGLDREERVLDVGAGSGGLLAELARWGFRNLRGVDPYLPEPVQLGEHVQVLVGDMNSVDGEDDLIIFHHSLEHVDDPLQLLLDAVARLSKPKGRVAVSVPVAEGPVWHEYRDNWAGLDAPVHRLVPTMEGLRRLAERAGMRLVAERRTCTPYHVVTSQLVSQRIPVGTPLSQALSEQELQFLHRKVRALRRSGTGPQATVAMVRK